MSTHLRDFFDFLKTNLPHYEDRPEQQQMAEAVYEAILGAKRLLVEAGTGTGKSFAYLIPAILSGKKTVVSTATIALQEQLARKDLLFLQGLNYRPFTYGVLKGKNNYLCIKRFNDYGPLRITDKRFLHWAAKTTTGDKDDLEYLPEFWSQVAGDSMDCAGRQCPFYEQCLYFKNYRRLYRADIIVVNHYLLAFDLLSDGSLIPSHETLIIDEAHEIDDALSKAVGISISPFRVKWLLNRLRGLKIVVDALYEAMEQLFRTEVTYPATSSYLSPIGEGLIERLRAFRDKLSLNQIIAQLERRLSLEEDLEVKDRVSTTINLCKALQDDISRFIEQSEDSMVYYLQKGKDGIEFHARLVDTSEAFNNLTALYDTVVMTSATLTTGGNFDFITQRLGLKGYKQVILESPFDYHRQAALFIARHLPPPDRDEDFLKNSVYIIGELINTSKGRALVLFTSYRHLKYVSENLSVAYPIASQGDMPNSRLLRWFIDTPNSVLLATQSFWQGIDIKGDKLSMLIIAKIPFAPPGDPVYDARCSRLGDRWFMDLALPSAILTIRQGFGRLIRTSSDRGVVALLDSRINHSSYGNVVLSSLPAMRNIGSIEEVYEFFNMTPQ
jgi:ATP-dependent DNA helicase DinG